MTAFPEGTILGYPRIGRRRELKKAVEAFWAGRIDEQELERTAADLRAATRERLAALGLGRTDSSIPESFSFYDQVLDAAATVGAIPARFDDLREADGTIGLSALFTVARGEGERAAGDDEVVRFELPLPRAGDRPGDGVLLASDRLVREVAEAAAAGFVTRPVVVGPVTLLALAKASDDAPEGFEPLASGGRAAGLRRSARPPARRGCRVGAARRARARQRVAAGHDRPARLGGGARARGAGQRRGTSSILVATPYASLGETFGTVAAAPIEAIAVDLVRGAVPEAVPGLEGKTLVGGVIDGHNIWRGDLSAAFDSLEALRALGAPVSAATSTSLLHVPHDVEDETALDERLVSWLAFADQKVQQVVTLARGLSEGRTAIATELDAATAALQDRLSAPGVRDGAVRSRALTDADFARAPYAEREEAQNVLGLPVLPLTTIGSFPQTGDIRRARAQFLRGEIPEDDYEEFLRREVAAVVSLQEDLGLDVLVHGEPERNDMVQYFAEHLDGFAVTQHGWVQSYGSRATRPSILWGDVSRPAPITVAWSAYAQSLTAKHMKGMLTGPVTILAWSFVRDDQPLGRPRTRSRSPSATRSPIWRPRASR